jgi:Lon protease-like protein
MAAFEDLTFSIESFSGVVRLFPLPNLVLFPHVMQPLHIFEPRYRAMLEDALADDRLITMALLAPGWERDYEGRPPLYPMGCLGRVTTYCRLADGTYNVLLLGLKRVRLLRELAPRSEFREARIEICDDAYPPGEPPCGGALQRRLRKAILHILPSLHEVEEQLDQLLAGDVPLGLLTDVLSYTIDVELEKKHALLAEPNVCRRAEMLLQYFAATAGGYAGQGDRHLFPPRFSAN